VSFTSYGARDQGRRARDRHLHGDGAPHFSFPKRVWRELHDEGRIVHHPVFPGKTSPAARAIHGDDDVADVIDLLRLNYDRKMAARARRDQAAS
jgi:hypothetical protein